MLFYQTLDTLLGIKHFPPSCEMGKYQQSQEGFTEEKIFYKHKDFVKCSEGCITNLIWQMIQIKIFQESTERTLINSMHLELDVW